MAVAAISWQGILLRLVAALILVFATYNPSNYSYFHWASQTLPSLDVVVIFVGVVLLIAWTIFIRATLRSLGAVGLLLAIAFFGTLLWLVVDKQLVSPNNTKAMTYLLLVVLAAVLATGLSWSHIRRRISGQADVDDVDE